MPTGLKPVRRTLATGEVRLYWYHRATGKRLERDPRTAAGMLEVSRLDDKGKALKAAQEAASGTIAHLWAAYIKSPEWRGLKPRTRSEYQRVRDWLGPAAEKGMLLAIETKHIMALRDRAFAAHGRRFGNYVVQVLRLLFTWGRLRGWIKTNPATGVPSIRRPIGLAHRNRPWTPAEVAAFAADDCPIQLLVPFAMGLFAGMRQGDALITTKRAYDGAALRWIAGKNGEACMAPVTGPLKVVLDVALALWPDTVQICATSGGTTWTESGFRASFFKRIRKLVKEGKMQPGCTYHGLRHTIASAARNDGESDSRVAAAIGDRSPAMAQIYGRDADRLGAQNAILEAAQKRFTNIDWKTPMENASKADAVKRAKSLKK